MRDRARAARVLADGVDLVVGDLTRPDTLGPALEGVEAIVFTHGSTTSERDVRDNDYTGVANVLKALVVRPGWFDYNQPDQRKITLLQGYKRQSGSPADGVIARDQIARVLIDSLHIDAADHKTVELIADHGPEQEDLATVFGSLTPDSGGSLDAAEDTVHLPVTKEPETFRRDLATISAGNHRAEA